MARTIDLRADEAAVLLVIQDLNVTIELDPKELRHLARKAHENKNRRAKSGPCRASVYNANRWPEAFADCYSVQYENVRPSERTPGTMKRSSGSRVRLTKAQAEALFDKYVAEGEETYVALWGPTSPNEWKKTRLRVHGRLAE